MSNKPFWKEAPADGEPETDHAPAVDDTPLLGRDIFPDLGTITEIEAGAAALWPVWKVEPPVNHRGVADPADDGEYIERRPLSDDDGDDLESASMSLPGTDAHPIGDLYMPIVFPDESDTELFGIAHRIAGMIERLKAAVGDDAIDAYLQWIRDDDLPGRIERNIVNTRPRWHRILISPFLPQYPKLWDAPDDLAHPDDPGYEADPGFEGYPDDFVPPADMPIWMKEIRTVYGQESARVVVAANALDAQTDHARELAHTAVHDETAWRDHARDALAHAAMFLTSYSDDDPDAIEVPGTEIPARIQAALKPQAMARSILYLSGYMAGDALNRYRDALRTDVEQNPGRWVDLIKQARHDLGLPPVEITLQGNREAPAPIRRKSLVQKTLFPMAPAYRENLGGVPKVGAWVAMKGAIWEPWEEMPGEWPQRRFPLDTKQKEPGEIIVSLIENPNGATDKQRAAAWEIVSGFNEVLPTVLFHIGAEYIANRKNGGRLEVSTSQLARLVFGRKPEKRHLEAVNDAMYSAAHIVVSMSYWARPRAQKKASRVRRDDLPTRHLLTWDRLHQNGRNVTYDVQLGYPMLEALRDFPNQVATVKEGAFALDRKLPARTRLAQAIVEAPPLKQMNWERYGISHAEILEMAGRLGDGQTLDRRRRHDMQKQGGLTAIMDSPDVFTYRYAPGVNLDSLTWEQWLQVKPYLTIIKYKTDSPPELETEDRTPPDPEHTHPGWNQ